MRARFRWDEEFQRSRVQLTLEAHLAWQEFLNPVPWDSFLTITFKKPRKDPYYALQAVSECLSLDPGAVAFLSAETHKSGDSHIHGLIHWPWASPDGLRNMLTWQRLYARFGRTSLVKPFAPANVVKYVTKYCTKDLTDWLILGTIDGKKEG